MPVPIIKTSDLQGVTQSFTYTLVDFERNPDAESSKLLDNIAAASGEDKLRVYRMDPGEDHPLSNFKGFEKAKIIFRGGRVLGYVVVDTNKSLEDNLGDVEHLIKSGGHDAYVTLDNIVRAQTDKNIHRAIRTRNMVYSVHLLNAASAIAMLVLGDTAGKIAGAALLATEIWNNRKLDDTEARILNAAKKIKHETPLAKNNLELAQHFAVATIRVATGVAATFVPLSGFVAIVPMYSGLSKAFNTFKNRTKLGKKLNLPTIPAPWNPAP